MHTVQTIARATASLRIFLLRRSWPPRAPRFLLRISGSGSLAIARGFWWASDVADIAEYGSFTGWPPILLSLDQSCIQPGFAASYAPVSEHLHLARKRTVFLYAIAPIVCTVFLYTVHTSYEFRFIHDLARKRTVSESIYSTVSLYKHD